MILYYVQPDSKIQTRTWHRTRDEAHARAKEIPALDPPIIVQVDVNLSHAGAVLALSGSPQYIPKAAWLLSPRKGLRATTLSEAGYDAPAPSAPKPEPAGRGPEVATWLQGRPKHERMDCVVRALAVAADVPYERVHAMLKAHGRKDGRRTSDSVWVPVARALGLRRHRAGMTIARFLDDVRHVPRCAGFIRGHAFGVVRGVVTDTQGGGRPRQIVREYWSKD